MATQAELEYLVKVYDRELADLQRKIEQTNRAMGRGAEAELSRGQRALQKHAKQIQQWSAIAVGAGVLGALKVADAASDLNEEVSKSGVVFRKSSGAILEWSKTTATSIGISRTAALKATGTFGNMLVPMGLARAEAAKMSKRMVTLTADLSSFNNAAPDDVMEALRSGLSGETEPLRKFGIFLNDARIKQEALTLGLWNGKGALTAAAKAQATYAIILKDTKDAQGDFSRTSGSAANQQRILRAQISDLATELGQGLLPVYQGLLKFGVRVVMFMREHATATKVLAGVVGGLALGFLTLSTYVRIADVAMKATTFGLVVAGLVALGVALVAAYKSSDRFRAIVQDAFRKVEGAARATANFFTATLPAAFQSVKDWVAGNWPEIVTLISGPFAPLVALATDGFGIRSELIGALRWLVGAGGSAASAVSNAIKRGFLAVVWDFPGLLFGRVIQPMVNLVGSVVERAAELSRAVPRGIASVIWGLAGVFYDRIVRPLGNLIDDVLGKGAQIAGSIASGIKNGFTGAADSVLGVFRGFLNRIIGVFNKIPFVPDIPALAEGGVLRGPTFALVGEDGPEVVIPLGAKRRKRGQQLLSLAAKVLGMDGDYPGPYVSAARAGHIPALADGGFILPGSGSSRGSYVDLMISAMRAQANGNGGVFRKIASWGAGGAARVVDALPDPPSFPGDKMGMVRSIARGVKGTAAQAIRDLFARKQEWSADAIVEAFDWALSQMGKPYVWGGGHGGWNFNLPGYDCSGFASHAAKKGGAALGGPGTTMSLYPVSRPGQGWLTFGFRGMSQSNPRKQHMGARILGTWFQFGDPGRSGGSDAQWDSVRVPPGLPGYRSGTPYVPHTGPAILHRGEAVVPAHRNRGAGGSGPIVHIEHMEIGDKVDAHVAAELIGRRLQTAGVAW